MNENILIIDDAEFSRTVMKQALLNAGFDNITEATTAAEARMAFSSDHPDLTVLDIMLPDNYDLKLLHELIAVNKEARIAQYNAVLRFFVKFLQGKDEYSLNVRTILFWIYVKLGDISYEEALQNQDISRYFLAVEYYNQSLIYANNLDEKKRNEYLEIIEEEIGEAHEVFAPT